MLQGKSRLAFLLFCLTAFCLFVHLDSESVSAATFEDGTHGGKPYKLYVPSSYDGDKDMPLVVMLHGCTQNAADFAAGTQMNVVAEQEGFLVLYPEQPFSGHFNHCWNWYEPAHQARGAGEPAIIAGMVDKVKGQYAIDDSRVYVTGLSAGGAMSVIMGATYPDVFTAIGVGSGLEYKAGTNMIEGLNAMRNGGPNPKTQGRRAYEAMGEYARIVPVIVFHGTNDTKVYPINGDQVVKQWIETNNLVYENVYGGEDYISQTPAESVQHDYPNVRNYTQDIYTNTKGESIVEKFTVQGLAHAWSGGSSQGSHTDPQGPNASQIMWNFFKTKGKPTTIANPPGGEYEGNVTVELIADREGTTYYTTDGTKPTTESPVYSEPIFIEENTELKFFTVDSNDQVEDVKTEFYTIKQDKPTTTANPPGGNYKVNVTVELTADRDGTTYYTTDGTEPTKDSSVYAEPILIEEDTVLKFFTVDSNDIEEDVNTETYTIVSIDEPETVNIAIQQDNSGFVGQLMVDGMSNRVLQVGDKGMFNTDTYRTILSFDTSSLADKTVSLAKLVLYTKSSTGTINNITVDSKHGHFGSSASIERTDYSASATNLTIATNTIIPHSNGERMEFVIPVSALNADGLTQLRLRAGTTAGFTSNLLEIYKDENEDYIPYLEIELEN